jgi:REP element-mobilizing transposase RayT
MIPHRARPQHLARHPVHATLRLTNALGPLRTKSKLQVMKSAFRAQKPGPFRLVHFSIQSGHIHLIVEAEDKDALTRGMHALEIRLALRLNRLAGRKGRVFTDRYHARALRTPRETRNALAYVLLNARHHALKPPRRGTIDPCSSGLFFNGWSRPCALPGDYKVDDPDPATLKPTTWLLKLGWQKAGLISPDAIPGAV